MARCDELSWGRRRPRVESRFAQTAAAGNELRVMFFELSEIALEEDDVLVFGRADVAARFVGGEPELGFEADVCRRVGGAVRGARVGHIATFLLLGLRVKSQFD